MYDSRPPSAPVAVSPAHRIMTLHEIIEETHRIMGACRALERDQLHLLEELRYLLEGVPTPAEKDAAPLPPDPPLPEALATIRRHLECLSEIQHAIQDKLRPAAGPCKERVS